MRKSDLALVKEIIPEAISKYRDIMLKEVLVLKGKKKDEVVCRVTVDESSFLPEWNEKDPENSCLGGFMMFARKNRIVCSQTLDDRMSLVFAQAIPMIRVTLFPSLQKAAKPVVEHSH